MKGDTKIETGEEKKIGKFRGKYRRGDRLIGKIRQREKLGKRTRN